MSAYKEAFLSIGYDDFQHLGKKWLKMKQSNMTMKGHIRRLISGAAASKSARNNPPTTGNSEDEKGDLDKPSAINFEPKV